MERWQSWSIVPDLKSGVLKGTVGSNPTLSAVEFARGDGLIRYFQTSRVKTQNIEPLVFGLNVEKKREYGMVAEMEDALR